MQKLSSLTIFFPFFNDAGTVEHQIKMAFEYGRNYAHDLEVIALHGGPSKDNTFEEILSMKKKYTNLKVINKYDNTEGYAVIKYGFKAASKDWIFYTDGDAQYHLEKDLMKLVEAQHKKRADVVNGYKIRRGDNIIRIVLGKLYAILSKMLFKFPIRDVDCDFRLMRKSLIEKISFEASGASILPEMIKKLELAKAKIVEVPVNHYAREYGRSNYSAFDLLKEKIIGDFKLYIKMRKVINS